MTQTFNLIGDVDIRDYNNWVWTNTINGTTTTQVWTNDLGSGSTCRSSSWTRRSGTDADLIEIVDSGGFEFQRAIVQAITVEVPGPAGVGVFAAAGLVTIRAGGGESGSNFKDPDGRFCFGLQGGGWARAKRV